MTKEKETKEPKEKISKEMKAIIKAIEKYCEKHDHKVQFYGSFMAFKGKEYDVVDDRIFAFGPKDTLLVDMKEAQKMIKKEKEDFISW